MRDLRKKKSFPFFYVLLSILSLLSTTLACGELREFIDPFMVSSQNLSNMDLHGKAMSGFDFSEKTMMGVNMAWAQIVDANFTNADLREANLFEAIANGAIFNGADLRGANLDRLCFHGATWEGAKLDPRWHEVVFVLEEKLKPNQDLSGLDFSKLCLYSYDLRNVILLKSRFI